MYQKTKDVLDALKKEFLGRISAKTGWGKNEIEKAFNEALIDVLSSKVDE